MADNNRIGDACWYRLRPDEEWTGGTLRAWSTDTEDYVAGPGMFPVGVVEDEETGMCHSVHVNLICFASAPPA